MIGLSGGDRLEAKVPNRGVRTNRILRKHVRIVEPVVANVQDGREARS
jgi:hypothetical protein